MENTTEKKKNENSNNQKYTITTKPSDLIFLNDQNFQTNEEYIKKFIDIINEPNSSSWEEMISKNDLHIYNKRCFLPDNKTKSLIVKTITKLPCKFHIVEKILKDYDFRSNYDSFFKVKPMIIKSEISNEEKDITKSIEYFYLKMPFIFSDRDFVNEKIECNNNYLKENSYCYVFHSIIDENCPEKNKIVRGEFIIQGIFIEKENENNTLLRMCSELNMKMAVGSVESVYKKIPEKQSKFIEDLIKNYEEYVKINNLN
jgi:hypothetical protein